MPSRGSHRLIRTLAGALAVTALAAPTAGARPATEWTDSSNPATTKPPAPTVTRTIDDGLDWGSAGSGAGAGAAIVLLTLAGVRAGSRARRRPAR